MSDTESVSTVTAVGSVGTATKRERKPPATKSDKKTKIEEAVNGGKRWKSEHLRILWAHRELIPTKEGEKNAYDIVTDMLGRTNVACRIKICHIKHNVRKGAVSLEDALAGKRLPLQTPQKVLEEVAGTADVSPRRTLSPEEALPTQGSFKLEPSGDEAPPMPAPKQPKNTSVEKKTNSPKRAPSGKKVQNARVSKPRKEAAAKKKALSTKAGKPISGQACKSQSTTPIDSRACSPEDARAGKSLADQASKQLERISIANLVNFRSSDGERVLTTTASEVMAAANALLGLSFGSRVQPEVPDRSIASEQNFRNYYIQDEERQDTSHDDSQDI